MSLCRPNVAPDLSADTDVQPRKDVQPPRGTVAYHTTSTLTKTSELTPMSTCSHWTCSHLDVLTPQHAYTRHRRAHTDVLTSTCSHRSQCSHRPPSSNTDVQPRRDLRLLLVCNFFLANATLDRRMTPLDSQMSAATRAHNGRSRTSWHVF